MRDYKKYDVWVKSHDLVLIVYKEIAPLFPKSEQFELTSQMKRAAYSIPFNIVEGCGRNSDKDFAHFLDMSLGSANELEYCFLLSKDLSFIDIEQYNLLFEKVNEIKAKLINLIKSIRGGSTN
ncbi:MAG: four helix bundle protein [Bacteroidetes bacterium]|nr:four helix bundle protein [Bacteroidota bacterium]